MINRLLLLLVCTSTAWAQTSPFNVIFLSKPNAQTDRDYLMITNFSAGTNITLTKTATLNYSISAAVGTNSSGIALNKGVVTLAGGVSVVNTALAYNTNVIQLTYVSLDGRLSTASVRNIVPGVSFTIQSGLGVSDNNNVCWSVLNP